MEEPSHAASKFVVRAEFESPNQAGKEIFVQQFEILIRSEIDLIQFIIHGKLISIEICGNLVRISTTYCQVLRVAMSDGKEELSEGILVEVKGLDRIHAVVGEIERV